MSDIFISYASNDRPRAETFAHTLEGRGWSTFWDRTIPTGKTWRETIGRELQGARCVIVLWSKNSIESRWVQEEADDAQGRGVLVPILIENVQPPIGFRSIQAAHLENWNGTESTEAFRRLIADIAALIGPPPKGAEIEGRKLEAEVEREMALPDSHHTSPSIDDPSPSVMQPVNLFDQGTQQISRSTRNASASCDNGRIVGADTDVEIPPLWVRLTPIIKLKYLATLILLILLGLGSWKFYGEKLDPNPAFDCHDPSNNAPTPQIICRIAALAAKDRNMNVIFRRLSDGLAAAQRAALFQQQRLWLEQRDTCGTEVRCISDYYDGRITVLKSQYDQLHSDTAH